MIILRDPKSYGKCGLDANMGPIRAEGQKP